MTGYYPAPLSEPFDVACRGVHPATRIRLRIGKDLLRSRAVLSVRIDPQSKSQVDLYV